MNPEMSKPRASLPPTRTVDTHFHVFDAHRAVAGARYVPGYAAGLPQWQALAAGVGVSRGVLVQTSFLGTDNSHLLQQLASAALPLRGVAVVAPHSSTATWPHWQALGVRGIRLNLSGISHGMDAWTRASALWDAVLALGWHVELHTDAGALPAVMAALPAALPLVLDHFAKPLQASPADATVRAVCQRSAAQRAGVFIKLSAPYRLPAEVCPQALAQLWQQELGTDSLLWGSDWPCTNHEAQAHYPALHAALDHWLAGLAQADRVAQAIRWDNPLRLYWGSAQALDAAV